MLSILGSIFGGFIAGSAINCVKEGVRIRPYHSKKGRAEIKQNRQKIRKMVKTIYWDPKNDPGPKWYD